MQHKLKSSQKCLYYHWKRCLDSRARSWKMADGFLTAWQAQVQLKVALIKQLKILQKESASEKKRLEIRCVPFPGCLTIVGVPKDPFIIGLWKLKFKIIKKASLRGLEKGVLGLSRAAPSHTALRETNHLLQLGETITDRLAGEQPLHSRTALSKWLFKWVI